MLCYSGFALAELRRHQAEVPAQFDVPVPEPFAVGRGRPRRLRGGRNQPLIPSTPLGRVRHGDDAQFATGSPHTGRVPSQTGRHFLLCSDSPTDAMPLETIESALTTDYQAFIAELLEQTLPAGAPDNVSIMLASIRPRGGDKEYGRPKS